MMLIDTTVLVDVLRDSSGANGRRLLAVLQAEDVAFTRFTELEILAGARDEADWGSIQGYLTSKAMLDPTARSGGGAARIYFDLRRLGRTVRKVIDCCIAQLALENDLYRRAKALTQQLAPTSSPRRRGPTQLSTRYWPVAWMPASAGMASGRELCVSELMHVGINAASQRSRFRDHRYDAAFEAPPPAAHAVRAGVSA